MANILIVEDDPDVADLYGYIFRGHHVSTFYDVPQSLNYLTNSVPDLAILDIHLPSGSGLDILKHITTHNEFNTTRVIGVSADDTQREDVEQNGASAFLAKPFDIDELSATARRLLLIKQLTDKTIPRHPKSFAAVPEPAQPTPAAPAPPSRLRGTLNRLIDRVRNL